jgi:hypothetical protein
LEAERVAERIRPAKCRSLKMGSTAVIGVNAAVPTIEVKLEQRPGGTHVDLRHRAIGFIDSAHRQNVTSGWKKILDGVAEDCSARASAQST